MEEEVKVENAEVVYDPQDVQNNKGIAWLSYMGPLVFIPLFARKDSPYAQFHARQGFSLFFIEVAGVIGLSILCAIFNRVKVIGTLFDIIYYAFEIASLVFAIIGIVNAAKGNAKKLPIVGDLDAWSWFSKKN